MAWLWGFTILFLFLSFGSVVGHWTAFPAFLLFLTLIYVSYRKSRLRVDSVMISLSLFLSLISAGNIVNSFHMYMSANMGFLYLLLFLLIGSMLVTAIRGKFIYAAILSTMLFCVSCFFWVQTASFTIAKANQEHVKLAFNIGGHMYWSVLVGIAVIVGIVSVVRLIRNQR